MEGVMKNDSNNEENEKRQVHNYNFSVTFYPFQRFSFSSLFESFFITPSIDFATSISVFYLTI